MLEHPIQRTVQVLRVGRAFPLTALSPIDLFCRTGWEGRVSDPLLVLLGQAPSLHPLHLLEEFPETRARACVRGLRGYYGLVRLPRLVHQRRASSDFPLRSMALPGGLMEKTWDLPVLARGVSVHAQGL